MTVLLRGHSGTIATIPNIKLSAMPRMAQLSCHEMILSGMPSGMMKCLLIWLKPPECGNDLVLFAIFRMSNNDLVWHVWNMEIPLKLPVIWSLECGSVLSPLTLLNTIYWLTHTWGLACWSIIVNALLVQYVEDFSFLKAIIMR